jgi:tRNA(adenine34) deaminase
MNTADDVARAPLQDWMQLALDEARRGLDAGEAPIGCVLLDADGRVIGAGYNAMRGSGIVTAHAEMKAFEAAAHKVLPGHSYTLVSTLEPCVMCMGAAMQAGVTTIVFGLKAPADAGTTRVDPPESPNATAPKIIGQISAEDSRTLFSEWLELHADDETRSEQRLFIDQLLALTDDSLPADAVTTGRASAPQQVS